MFRRFLVSFSPLFVSGFRKSIRTYLSIRNLNIQRVMPNGFVDVHAHLIHEEFKGEEDAVAIKCREYGLDYVIVNGLEPISNRAVLDLCDKHSNLLPALGIYPLDAASNVIQASNWNHPFSPPTPFDIDAEVDFIDGLAGQGRIIAVGECGLDK